MLYKYKIQIQINIISIIGNSYEVFTIGSSYGVLIIDSSCDKKKIIGKSYDNRISNFKSASFCFLGYSRRRPTDHSCH